MNTREKKQAKLSETADAMEYARTLALTPQMKKNAEGEGEFRHWIFEVVRRDGSLDYNDMIDSGAEKADLSQQTVLRYAKKLLSREGMYMLLDGQVMFKPEYEKKYRGKAELSSPPPEPDEAPSSGISMFKTGEAAR